MTLLMLRQLTIVSACTFIFLLNISTGLASTLPIQFTVPATYPTSSTTYGIVAADFNGDGNSDIAVVGSNFPGFFIDIFFGNGDGSFQSKVRYLGTGSGGSSTRLRAAYFNGDGKPDLAVTHVTNGLVSILINNGDGTFQSQVDYSTGGDLPYEMVTADLNGDGKIDLAFTHEINYSVCIPEAICPPSPTSSNVSVLPGNGDGTFQPATTNTINGSTVGLAVLDANGDGKFDLAALNSTQKGVYLLYGLGNGLFQSAQGNFTYSSSYNNTLRSVDLNSDSIPDLFMSDSNSGQVSMYLGAGNGQYLTPTYASAGIKSEADDLNKDGLLDLIGIWSGSFNIMLGAGNGTFLPAEMYAVGGNLQGVAVADFDKDGLPDLAVANSSTSAISILLNMGAKMASPSSLSFSGMNLNSLSAPKVVTITNSIGRPLVVSDIGITGLDSTMFNVTPGGQAPCVSLTPILLPNESCTIQVVFTPTLYNSRSASLVISSDHPVTPSYTIALSGQANSSPLTILWSGAATGTVTLLPSTTYLSGPRTLYYYSIDTVTLEATPGVNASFSGWSGCDFVNGNQCTVTMNMPHTVTATFDALQPIALDSTSSRFSTLGTACDSADDNSSFSVMVGSFTEQLQLSRPKSYKLRGGCDSAFASCSGTSALIGAMTVSAGTVTIENFQLQGTLNINNGTLVTNQVSIL